MAEGEYCRVHFRVRAPTSIGQVVGLGGTSNRLGNFDKNRITPLVTTPDSYPIWYTKDPIVIPRYQVCQYKYCTIEGGSFRSFERSDIMRTLKPEDPDTYIEDVFNPLRLEFSGFDSEANLLQEMQKLTSNTVSGISLDSSMHSSIDGSMHGVGNTLAANEDRKLFLTCYHLPVKVVRNEGDTQQPFTVTWTDSLIAKTEGSVSEGTLQTFWVGTVKVPEPVPTSEELDILKGMLAETDCIPIFLDKELAENAYQGYCKQVMWPIFHNVDQLDHLHSAWNVKDIPEYIIEESKGRRVSMNATSDTNGGGIIGGEQSSSIFGGGGGGSSATTRMSESDSKDQWKDSSSRGADQTIVAWQGNENGNEEMWFQAYTKVASIFDQELGKVINPNDIIWVHDYHLMLLPKMLRERNIENLRVAFFLHIPFPTSQIFRSIANANELLGGMCNADILGFHAFDHSRHFLNAAKRVLGYVSKTLQGGMICLSVQDRECIVTMSHVSIEPQKMESILNMEEVSVMTRKIREKHKGKKIVVGIDVCQRLSGISLKMAAFDKLLTDYAGNYINNDNMGEEGLSKIVLIQKAIRTGSRQEDEETTSRDVKRMVQSMNERYSSALTPNNSNGASQPVVDYEEVSSVSMIERVALYLAADVFLQTSVREGLNLMPLEYIFARKGLPKAGIVIASEFSTCSSLLNGAIKVNPFYTLTVADAMDRALNLSQEDCNARRLRDIDFIGSHPSALWTKSILADLNHLERHQLVKKKPGKGRRNAPILVDDDYIVSSYELANARGLPQRARRVFIFDYGGTLLHKEKFTIYIKQSLSAISGRKPTDKMMESIKTLAADENNHVVVMTGLTRVKLGSTFSGPEFKDVSLVTSNGLVYSWGENIVCTEDMIAFSEWKERSDKMRTTSTDDKDNEKESGNSINTDMPTSPDAHAKKEEFQNDYGKEEFYIDEDGRTWRFMDFELDWQAVCKIAVPIISKFTYRTNGTCLSPRIPGVGWSYFGGDPDWGTKQARQLCIDLEAALANFDVKVVSQIQGSIEIVPSMLDKGLMVSEFLKRLLNFRAGVVPSFLLVMGDEESDDKMYESVYKFIANAPPSAGLRDMKAFTVNIGKRDTTKADLYLKNVKAVEDLVGALAQSTLQEYDSIDDSSHSAPNAGMKMNVEGVFTDVNPSSLDRSGHSLNQSGHSLN